MWDFILNKIHLGKLSLKYTKTHIYTTCSGSRFQRLYIQSRIFSTKWAILISKYLRWIMVFKLLGSDLNSPFVKWNIVHEPTWNFSEKDFHTHSLQQRRTKNECKIEYLCLKINKTLFCNVWTTCEDCLSHGYLTPCKSPRTSHLCSLICRYHVGDHEYETFSRPHHSSYLPLAPNCDPPTHPNSDVLVHLMLHFLLIVWILRLSTIKSIFWRRSYSLQGRFRNIKGKVSIFEASSHS